MIILYHNNYRVVDIIGVSALTMKIVMGKTIALGLIELATKYPDERFIWCHQNWNDQLNVSLIGKLLHHKKMLLSFNPSELSFFDSSMGYIDTSLFIKINKEVSFPTWQMSSIIGCVHAEVLLALNNKISVNTNFDYFLCSLAKLLMPKGLICYSEPQLLKPNALNITKKANTFLLFRFVKQHYKIRWVFLLLLNLFLYERKFPLLPFLFSLFYRNRCKVNIDLDDIKVKSTRKVINKATVDVIIPSIGRKKYLYDVLKDLKTQTHLPTNVIIVEQNPNQNSVTELDYLTNEKWPFEIQHIFTYQVGVCNARNLALKETNSEWVFFADDDIRIETNFIKETLDRIKIFGSKAVTMRCFQIEEKQKYQTVFQWVTFGSGCSFVFGECLQNCKFKMGYEFGFGEDGDFGMQLRNLGYDVLYLHEPEILHLKAPIGGFRTKTKLRWHFDSIQPKPSPTVMLYQISNCTREQTNSYKTTLFFKYYRHQKIKNPIRYYFHFQKQWERSVFWANELKKQNEI